MEVYITNIYWLGGTARKAQNTVADIARKELQYNELGIHCYPVDTDSPEMLRTRLDGILSSVCHDGIVIFQVPTWNGIKFDESFMNKLNTYKGLKKIIFIHDVPPLMFENDRHLIKRYIELYNQADMAVIASQNMAEYLQSEGMNVRKIIDQKMWDFPVSFDQTMRPPFRKVINFAGDPNQYKFEFIKSWNFQNVQLAVTVDNGDWAKGRNVRFLGWFNDDNLLANALRRSGGFGLLWSEDPYWCEYMKLNASYKISTYLASGLPVIVHSSIPEKDTVIRKNLGLVVDSLDEAADRIEQMSEGEYRKMTEDVEMFANLLRNGYFAKKVLTDAVFKLLAD